MVHTSCTLHKLTRMNVRVLLHALLLVCLLLVVFASTSCEAHQELERPAPELENEPFTEVELEQNRQQIRDAFWHAWTGYKVCVHAIPITHAHTFIRPCLLPTNRAHLTAHISCYYFACIHRTPMYARSARTQTYAGFANDELRPVSNTPYNWMNLSITLFR